MNNAHAEQISGLFNAILARIPLADAKDLSILADIMQNLQWLAAEPELPEALAVQANRTAELVEQIIFGAVKFDAGMPKIVQSVTKMFNAFEAIATNTEEPETAPAQNSGNKFPSDMIAIASRFASSQQEHLERFEELAMQFEKNPADARDELKRILHTWKGEFGVLDLPKFSSLIHGLEEALGTHGFPTESLFRFKDLLTEKISKIGKGELPQLSSDEESGILLPSICEDETVPVSEPEPPTEEPVAEIPESKVIAADEMVDDSEALDGEKTLIADFVAESFEHIGRAEPLLISLESDPTDMEVLNTIFRACHTVKGVAGFIGFKNIGHLAHSIENLMDSARKSERVLNAADIDLLLAGFDGLKACLEAIKSGLIGKPYLLPSDLGQLNARFAATLSSIEKKDPPAKVGEILVARGVVNEKNVAAAIEKQGAGDPRLLGEILVQDNRVPPLEVAAAVESQKSNRPTHEMEETIRVPVERLDHLIDAIGEAVIAQSMVWADEAIRDISNLGLEKKIARASLIMRQIQELSMSLRMVSIKGTFQKMARLVRDLSKKVGKNVEFITEGEDTELDKSVVENIGDPLIHMIRNSIDHGIEDASERLASGKPEAAKVVLRAYHRSGSVFIEIEDDGKGLDRERILQKAIAQGLCKENAVPSDEAIYQYIFMPGFSTAAKVTDVSGRGVGMDVVKRNIEALNGTVDIRTEKGRGTTFTIRLPLTLAIIDGMIVEHQSEEYVIPTLSIVETLAAKDLSIESVLGKGRVAKVRDELVRIVDLGIIFGAATIADEQDGIVMIVEDMIGRKAGLHIDRIVGQQQVVVKSLGNALGDIPGVSGGAIMSDGTISLILDVNAIIKLLDE